jgi:hypothetical protein
MKNSCPLHCLEYSVLKNLSPEHIELCEHCALPLIILDRTGRALKYNSAFEERWNIHPERFLDIPGYNVFEDPVFGASGFTDLIELSLNGESAEFEFEEYTFPPNLQIENLKSRSAYNLRINVSPLMRDDQVEGICMFYASEDKPEEGKCYSESSPMNRLVGSAVDLKHEINNPLLLVTGNAQLMLAKKEELPPHMVKNLKKILRGAEKINKILDEHLTMTTSLYLKEDNLTEI